MIPPPGTATVNQEGTLSGGDVLPEFELPLLELFALRGTTEPAGVAI